MQQPDNEYAEPQQPVVITAPGAVRRILTMFGAAVAVFVVSVLLHNLIYAIWQVDEPFFFFSAVVIAPVLMAVSAVAALILFYRWLAGYR